MNGRSAAALGACAGGMAVAAMLALRLAAGVTSLIEVIGSGLALLLPGPVFGTMIDALQERGRPLLLLGTAALLIAIGAGLGLVVARWARSELPLGPAAMQSRAGDWWWRWLLPALSLWVLTQPLLLVAEGGYDTSAAVSTLADWLLLCGLVEILVGLPRLSGNTPGTRGSSTFSTMSRRRFMAVSGGALGAVSLGYLGSRVLAAQAPPALLGRGAAVAGGAIPAGVTPISDFYIVSKDLLGPPRLDPSTWRLELSGNQSSSVSYPQLLAMPHLEQVQTLECISNPVGGTLISTGVWRGVQLSRLLEAVGLPRNAKEVVFHCADGYSESLAVEEAMLPSTLLATHLNGRALPAQHGFPVRILVTGHYGMKDPKWLTGISTTAGSFSGYWEQQGWNAAAVPHIFSRFDFPAGSASLRAGRAYLLSGVAFAGNLGVQRVEVSADGGAHWVPARIQPQLSRFAWSVWSLPWRPGPGLYTLTVRAEDRQGRVQSARSVGSYPNGARGRQEIVVSVA